MYFTNRLKDNNNFSEYNIDCEYNRDIFNEKKYKEIVYDEKKHKIKPDLIMHKRGSNDCNILAIEFKTYFNYNKKSIKIDRLKLQALTNSELNYKYKIGLLITLGKKRDKVNIVKYINGKEIK